MRQELPAEAASSLRLSYVIVFLELVLTALVYILPSEKADFMMRIMNSDGSEAEQCGNAIRCVSKYVYDHKLIDTNRNYRLKRLVQAYKRSNYTYKMAKFDTVRVDMGQPILKGTSSPNNGGCKTNVIDYPIEVDGREFRFTAVSMGNPHCVIYVDDAVNMDLANMGS